VIDVGIFSFRERLRSRLLRLIDSRLAPLRERIDTLELVLTEHPYVASTSLQRSSLPSPVVSVILPTWNRAPVVGAAIQSVLAQDFSDWELVVVDDGSTDDTASVLASFSTDSRIRYVQLPHLGQCKARNYAHSVSTGSLIAYLDSDNLWYPAFLAAAVPVFAARSDVDCVYGAMVTDAHGGRILFEPFSRERLIAGNYIGMSTFIHRRSMIDRFGGFDEELSSLEDWDLILRYTTHAPAYPLPVPAVRYRVMDDKRVSSTQPHDVALKRIRHKWVSGTSVDH
jgi:glycosyltransferase involved in cell wall biosynthesis